MHVKDPLCRVQADWEAEFAKYKASPEYQKVNRWVLTPSLNPAA